MKKKILSLFLAACMLLPFLPALPVPAAAASGGTLGNIGSSSSVLQDLSLSETALPMTYAAYLASDTALQTAYRAYMTDYSAMTWSSAWSAGAVVDGQYEPFSRRLWIANATLNGTNWPNNDWTTTASGFTALMDTFMGGANADIWSAAATGAVLQSMNSKVIVRTPGSTSASGIAAYAYRVGAAGAVSLQIATANPESDTDFSYDTPNQVLLCIRINDTVVFPAGAQWGNTSTWYDYASLSALNTALSDLRWTVQENDLVQVCLREKTDQNNQKMGVDPIISLWASETATTAQSSVQYTKTKACTTNTAAPQTFTAWKADKTSTAQTDGEATREAYAAYLLTCGKLAQSGNWRVGGYTGTGGSFEPIAYRIPITNATFDTTLTAWKDTSWYATASAYAAMVADYKGLSGNNAFSIWGRSAVLYRKSASALRSANNTAQTVTRFTAPVAGQLTPTFGTGTSLTAATKFCLVYDGTPVWPAGAKLNDTTTWHTGSSSADALNAALDGFHLTAEAGKTLDFVAIAPSTDNIILGATVAYTNEAETAQYSEEMAAVTIGALPKVYSSYLAETGKTDSEANRAAYKAYLLQNGKISYAGRWSRGELLADGSYEALEYVIPMVGAAALTTATGWSNTDWTTNKTTYTAMIDKYLAGQDIGLWNAGNVLQSKKDSVRFRLTGAENASHIFAFAYRMEKDGLVGLQVATDSTVLVSGQDSALCYENADRMYVAIAVNGTVVWPQDATRDNYASWKRCADVTALNAALADARVFATANSLVQLCVHGQGNVQSTFLALDPVLSLDTQDMTPLRDVKANVALSADFGVGFYATAANAAVLDGLTLTVNGNVLTPASATRQTDYSYKVSWLLPNIAAKALGEEISYSFQNKTDGHVWQSGTTTTADLLMNYITLKDGRVDTSDKAAALAMATLNYGAAAQAYFGHMTEAPANADLPQADRVTASPIAAGSYTAAASGEVTEGAFLHWEAATLLLDDTVRIKLLLTAERAVDPASLALKLIAADGTAVESEWQPVARTGETDGRHFKVIIDVPMVNYRAGLKLGLWQDGSLVSDLLSYGVGAYACRVYEADAEAASEAGRLNTLVDTILTVGEAATAYRATQETDYDYSSYADVREIDTGLLVAPAVVQRVENRAALKGILADSPSHALLPVNKNLYVTNANGDAIATLSEALTFLDHRVIPLLAPADDAYDALYAYLSEVDFADLMLLSGNVTEIKRLKTVEPRLRPVLVGGESSTATIVANAASCGATACLLPAARATAETTAHLAERSLMVWYEAQDTTRGETVRLVTAGANGIVTTSRTAVEACLIDKTIFAPHSLTAPVVIIGHQGSTYNPTTQPNTIGAAKWAIEQGATLIEMDVYLTTDGKTVVMHDDVLDSTTNGTGKIEEMTLAEIQQYQVVCHTGAAPADIPTLEDYFIEFKNYKTIKGTDMVLNIEIKSGKPALIPVIADLIEEYDIADQCRIVCFSDSQIALFREACPTVPVICIAGSEENFATIMARTANVGGAAYTPNFAKFDYENLQKLAYRGITTHMWTPDSDNDIYQTYCEGASSLCLNWVNKIANVVTTFEQSATSYTLTAGGSTPVTLLATTYKGNLVDTAGAELVILSGNSSLTYANGSLSATAAGSATVMFRLPVTVGAQTLYLYTAPVAVQVG